MCDGFWVMLICCDLTGSLSAEDSWRRSIAKSGFRRWQDDLKIGVAQCQHRALKAPILPATGSGRGLLQSKSAGLGIAPSLAGPSDTPLHGANRRDVPGSPDDHVPLDA